eukprot:CAMPEP_0174263480 /NCGR_PEP_ID=MMETSP0439-20130205/18870_1 /TAXON_ID=0 /ORGANISM="Stereomyxa ramosa, Strain Chinc5" /LENGTH=34 /DNA_ID= /DNA_START= /DNA_END= /DNA_ORIENTATION=
MNHPIKVIIDLFTRGTKRKEIVNVMTMTSSVQLG